jgi:hypothetical protein
LPAAGKEKMRITHTHTKKNSGNYKIAVGKNEIKKSVGDEPPKKQQSLLVQSTGGYYLCSSLVWYNLPPSVGEAVL